MVRILHAFSGTFDEDYKHAVVTTDKHLALQKARAAGTIDQVDRSRQYTEPDLHHILASLNEAFTKIRVSEKALLAKDTQIGQLRKQLRRAQMVNSFLTLALLGIWKAVELFGPWVLQRISH